MVDTPHSDNGTDAEPTPSHPDLTSFQLRILGILADEARYGLAVKRALEDYYGEDVNHGRLYPNLDDLSEYGLVEKSERDRRTNEYALTPAGRRELRQHAAWLTHGFEEERRPNARVIDPSEVEGGDA